MVMRASRRRYRRTLPALLAFLLLGATARAETTGTVEAPPPAGMGAQAAHLTRLLQDEWRARMAGPPPASEHATRERQREELATALEAVSLVPLVERGGPIMWPLIIASVIAVGTVVERVSFLTLERARRSPSRLRKFMDFVARGELEGARAFGRSARFCVIRMLAYALDQDDQSLEQALRYARERELARYRRGIALLDTVITLAPLLGLLGTVTGMMASFALIGGELSAPGAITGGIAEALIATAYGLGIAITSLIPFNLLNTRVERLRLEMDEAASQLKLLLGIRDPDAADAVAPALPGGALPAGGVA